MVVACLSVLFWWMDLDWRWCEVRMMACRYIWQHYDKCAIVILKNTSNDNVRLGLVNHNYLLDLNDNLCKFVYFSLCQNHLFLANIVGKYVVKRSGENTDIDKFTMEWCFGFSVLNLRLQIFKKINLILYTLLAFDFGEHFKFKFR